MEGTVMTYFKIYPSICLEENYVNLTQKIKPRDGDSKQRHPSS